AIHPVPADVLFDQIEAILEDAEVGAVKIGMLGGADEVHAVAEAVGRFRPPNVVLDPVLASSDGFEMLDDAGRQAMIRTLIPLCDLVTPNLMEASALTGVGARDSESMVIAGRKLIESGAKAT